MPTMPRQTWLVRRIAREAGYADPEEAALVLMEAGFAVESAETHLSRREAKSARDALISARATFVEPEAAKPTKPRWPRTRAETVHFLSVDDVVQIHTALTEEFRGTSDAVDPPGVKDPGGLQSAVFRPQMAHALFPTVLLAGAALVHGLNASHAFHNGNKRTSLLALAIFLEERNRRYLNGSQGELFDLIVAIASHDLVDAADSPGQGADPYFADREVLAVYRRLRGMVHAPSREDRALKWRELCRVLERFSCDIDPLAGNQAKIRRTLADGRTLMTVAGARNEGDEMSAIQVRQFRKELCLTEEYGIDSAIFYDGRQPHPELPELIRRYRGVLERLALYDRAD